LVAFAKTPNARSAWLHRLLVVPISAGSVTTPQDCAELCCAAVTPVCKGFAFQVLGRSGTGAANKNPNSCVTYSAIDAKAEGPFAAKFDLYTRAAGQPDPQAVPGYAPVVANARGAFRGGAGNHASRFAAASVQACADKCSNHAQCHAFSYSTAAGACTMHTELGTAVTWSNGKSEGWGFYKKLPLDLAGAYAAPVADARGRWAKSAGLHGQRLAAASAEACARECSSPLNDADCRGFSYSPSLGACTMHTELGAASTFSSDKSKGWQFYKKLARDSDATP